MPTVPATIPLTMLDPEVLEDPFPTLALLRKEEPVFFDEQMDCWLLTRHADVKAIFADPRLSRDRRLGRRYVSPPKGSWAYRFDNESFAGGAPEEHKRWRSRIAVGFTPRAVRRIEQQVVDVVEEFAAPIRGRSGTVDLVAEFTNPIPNTVISRMTGIPPYPGDEDRFRRLAQDVIRRFFPMADADNVRRGEEAIDELAEWVGKLAEERRQQPQDDLLSDLIHGNEGESAMTNTEIVTIIATLVAAGSETTTLGGTHALRLLLQHPDQLALLRADPSLSRNAVRESLRFGFGSAVGGTPRFALCDLELHGKQIKQGDMLMLSTSSANRDENVFEDPDRFDIARDNREMLAFGNGPHYCLGANLALQEMGCMLDAAIAFLPEGAELLEDETEWEKIGLMVRPVTLPVRFS